MVLFMKSRSASKHIVVIVLLFLLLNINSNCYAQTNNSSDSLDTSDTPPYPKMDSLKKMDDATLDKISFSDSDKIIKWKHSRDFSYIHYMDSLLRIQKDIKSDTVSLDDKTGRITRLHHPQKDNSYMNRNLNSLPFKILFWLMALFFIGFVSYKVLFKNGIFSKKKNELNTDEAEDAPQELIEISKYDSLISEAENAGDFNLATRYLFLKTLKLLSDKELIHFSPDKTNHEYLLEMKSNNYYNEFGSLTRNYEYAWYGKILIEANAYQHLKEKYQLFNKKV